MLVGGEHIRDVDGNMGSRDSSSQTKNQIRRSIITFEERPQTRERNRQCASVHGCLGGGNPSDINYQFVVDSLDKQLADAESRVFKVSLHT